MSVDAAAPPPIVAVERLTKSFRVADKDPGLMGTLRHFVRRRYKEIRAVDDVSFAIAKGEIVGFLGPNGAGKTTTLKMLSGLIHPTAGRCVVDGHVPFRRAPEFLRGITLVMGNKQQLLWDLPALDSLRIHAAVYGIPDDVRDARTRSLGEMLDVTDKLTQPVRKLSLGERMKVELLAALLHAPRVLFLDEPTLGLDVNAQAAIRQFLHRYNAETGATVLLTSHYMADITALCRRVLVIDAGRLVFDGALDELSSRYSDEREVRLELRAAPSSPFAADGARLVKADGLSLAFAVKRERVAPMIARAMAELDVRDVAIHDPPVETVLGALFSSGGSSGASATRSSA